MKQIDFNTYVRNKLNQEVGLSDKQKSLSDKTEYMNIIHNRLQMRQSDKRTNNLVELPTKSGQAEPSNNTNTSYSSKKRTRSNKIIHLKQFK